MARNAAATKRRETPAVSTVIPLPQNPDAETLSKGVKFQQAGEFAEAVKAYDEVLKVNPVKLAAIVNKGAALRQLGKHEEAMACFWRAISLQPDNLQAWHNAANALLDQGRVTEAYEALKAVIGKAPQQAEAWAALGRLLLQRKHFPAAEAVLKRALFLQPNNIDTKLKWAGLLLELGRLPESLAEYEALQKAEPQVSLAHSGVGQSLIGLGRIREGIAHLKHSLVLDKNNLDAHLGLARGHLLLGEFADGWREYEWRRHRTDQKRPRIDGAEWDGSDPTGKTILVYAEQGFGDTIQFLRYLPLLAEKGARVVVVCQKSLESLIARIEGVAMAHSLWRPLPSFDFYVPLMSLPHKLGLSEPPAKVPYIVSHKKAQLPRPPLGTRLRVGLVWAGSSTHPDDHNRSVGLEALMPLAGIPGVRLYSLQHGPRGVDATKLAHNVLIKDFSKHLKDFADTASVICELDLVITVDSAVAHLAGSLGKPVWVMIPCVPDWRWQADREDSPWYPTMKLFRQSADGDWKGTIARMTDELRSLTEKSALLEPEPTTVTAQSIFTRPDGQSRYVMTAPRMFLNDPGIGFLMRRERAGVGYEYATRSLLDAHLQCGDVFIDIGAHWGIMSLHAATCPAVVPKTTQRKGRGTKDGIRVLAFEPAPHNAEHLRRWIAENNVTEIEVIQAAVSDHVGKGALRPESTMGHSLQHAENGHINVVTVDGELKKRPDLKGRRAIVKIDVEGHEPEVIAGMKYLLKSGNVAIVIWERGLEYDKAEGQKRLKELRAYFDELGFTPWRFESEDTGGTLVPFIEDGRNGNVIEFAAGLAPIGSGYGDARPPPVAQPPDPQFDIAERAKALMVEGTNYYKQNKVAKALEFYAEAGGLDSRAKDLYNNVGVMLQGRGRQAAKIASYRRALAMDPNDSGVLSNLGNALREEGLLTEARQLYDHALALSPNNPELIYNAALVSRDDGRTEEALAQFEETLLQRPDNRDCKWDRALILLQMGDYAKGMPAYEARWGIDRAYKRSIPLPRWDGSPLNGRSIYLHDEQGFGDVMQFARFIPALKEKYGAGKVVMECQPQLMRLMMWAPGVDAVIPRERALPQCEVYSPLLSLPGLFGVTLEDLPATVPYLFAPDMAPETAQALPKDNRLKVGLVWAGQIIPRDRSCPLQKFLPLLDDPRIAPISLQVGERADELRTFGADAFITDMGPYLKDFAETAAVMNELDLMITIDTSVAHLAGALGVPTFLLLRYTSDWRWFDRIKNSPWYPTMTLLRQTPQCRWDEPLAEMGLALRKFTDSR